MYLNQFRDYCLQKKGVTEHYPFKGDSAWFKVMHKLFALTNVNEFIMEGVPVAPFHMINLKCDPEYAVELRSKYEGIRPAWHQNKTHWISIYTEYPISDQLIKDLIDHSYQLVVDSLPKLSKEQLALAV